MFFKALARETGGKLSRSGKVNYPALSIHHSGCVFTITNGLATGGKVWVTKLHMDNHLSQPFKLRIQPTDLIEEFSKKLGFQDIKLGNPEFDEQYLIKTPDASTARKMVNEELQQLLVKLRPLRPELWITEKYISVSIQMQYEIEGYRKLLNLGYELCGIVR